MNYKQKLIIILLLCISFFNNTLAKENKILVKVNNEIITSVDILNEIKFLSYLNKEFINIEKHITLIEMQNLLKIYFLL